MRLNRIVPIATFALSLCVALPSNAQSDEDKAAARALATQGAEALQAGKHAEALDLVTRAEALLHAPPHLLLIGRAQVGLGRLVAAKETFLKAIREQLPSTAPPAFKKAQAEAKEDLDAIEPRIGSLRIALKVTGGSAASKVTVKLDDQFVSSALIGVHRPVDPGKHIVAAFPPGASPVTQEITLGDGEKKEVELVVNVPVSLVDEENKFNKPPPPPPPPPPAGTSSLRILGIAGMGLGVAGLVTGGVFLGLSSSTQTKADEAFTKCKAQPGGCTVAERKDVSDLDQNAATQGTIGIAALVGGGVLAGAGVVLFIVGGKKAQPKPAAGFIMPYATPNGAGVFGKF